MTWLLAEKDLRLFRLRLLRGRRARERLRLYRLRYGILGVNRLLT